MKSILVPIDFSKNSDNALHFAVGLAKDLKAKIILLHTFESTVLFSKLPMMTMQLDYSYLFNSSVHKIQAYAKKLNILSNKIEVELITQQGLPSSRISEIALEKKVDLIVMGTTGKGAVDRIMLGSNTSRLIRNAPCMLLAIPPKANYKKFKKIVYATDLSKNNLEHAKQLIPFSKKFDSEIIFINIGENSKTGEIPDFKKLKVKINKIIHYSKIKGFSASDSDIGRGIDYFIKYHKADCLAVFTKHRGLFARLFSTSITKNLSLHASIPLLVIHENDQLSE